MPHLWVLDGAWGVVFGLARGLLASLTTQPRSAMALEWPPDAPVLRLVHRGTDPVVADLSSVRIDVAFCSPNGEPQSARSAYAAAAVTLREGGAVEIPVQDAAHFDSPQPPWARLALRLLSPEGWVDATVVAQAQRAVP